MSETPKGTDLPNPTIEVAGMRFSPRLGVAALQWLELEFKCGIKQIGEKFQKATTDESLSVNDMSVFAVALYIQANLDDDPELAKRKIRSLDMEDLMTIISRSLTNDFEAKDETVPLVESPQEST